MIAGPRMTTKIDGKMQNTSGNSIFTGSLLRLRLRPQPPPDAHLVGLGPQQPGDRHAEGVGLQHGEDERPQLGHVAALVHRAQRFGARRAEAGLPQHAPELVGERTGHRDRRALERLLEAEAGLDRDHEQVEDVGELHRDVVLAFLDLPDR